MKYTKSEVVGMFNRLLKAVGKAKRGWSLDYVSVYGGYVIEQQEESGGISHPYGPVRRSAKEMYLSMHMAAQALENLGER